MAQSRASNMKPMSKQESESQAVDLQNYVTNTIELLKKSQATVRKVTQLAAFVPDFILRGEGSKVPYLISHEAVVIVADVSGFTALTEAYSLRGKGGTDQLTKVLSNYIEPLAECILRAQGDIIKYAGDAFLAVWKIEDIKDYPAEVQRVIDCALYIQEAYGSYLCADVNITIKVKIGVGAGVCHTSGIGNDIYQHWVCFGPGVQSASGAEKHCNSTEVVIQQAAWVHCIPENYRFIPKEQEFYQITERRICFRTNEKRGRSSHNRERLTSSSSVIFETIRPLIAAAVDRKSLRLRQFVIPPVQKKLDDEIPLEYLNESRQVSICFIHLDIELDVNASFGDAMGIIVQKAFIKINLTASRMQGALTKVIMFDKGLTYLVVFGLPGYINENQSTHALKFSYKVRRILRNIRFVENVSIGVTTGSCYCGVLGHPSRQEYTVIGRKVNKAARLMVNYSHKLTCDQDTMYHSKLPVGNFVLMEAKELKGITDVGNIYEFQCSEGGEDQSVQRFDYPMLGREPELKYFRDCLQKAKSEFSYYALAHHMTGAAATTKDIVAQGVWMIIFEGENGIGKSRLLAACIEMADKMNLRAISITLNLILAAQAHYGVTSLILQALKMEDLRTGHAREEYLRRQVTDPELAAGLCMLNEILHTKFPINPKYTSVDVNASHAYGQHILSTLLRQMFPDELIVFVIDDAHLMDPLSWEYLLNISKSPKVITLCSLRRNNAGSPKISNSVNEIIYHNKNVKVVRLGGLDTKFCLPLACQIMEVYAIPTDLEHLLTTKSQGVPAWCDQVLKELLRTGVLNIIPFKSGPHEKTEMKSIQNKRLLERILNFKNRAELKIGWVGDGTDDPDDNSASMMSRRPIKSSTVSFYDEVSSLSQVSVVQREEEKLNPFTRMLVVKSDTNIASVPVSGTLKEILLDAFDEQNSNEQMLLKCASILGLRFSRKMLFRILPVFELCSEKYEQGLRNLMEARYFRCATAKVGTKRSQTEPPECFCKTRSKNTADKDKIDAVNRRSCEYIEEPAYWNCKFMEFVKGNMVEVLYELMTEDQRKELHLKAAKYLDTCVIRCSNCGGGNCSFLYGFSTKSCDGVVETEQAFRLAAYRRKSSNRLMNHGKSYADIRKNRDIMRNLSLETDLQGQDNTNKRRISIMTQIDGLKKTFQNNGTNIGQIELDILKAILEFETTEKTHAILRKRFCCSRVKQEIEETEHLEMELDNQFNKNVSVDIDDQRDEAEDSKIKESNKNENKNMSGGDIRETSELRRDSVDLRLCECSALQAKACVEMVKHYRFSEKYGRCLINLLDAAEAVITIGNGGQALVHLEDAVGLMNAIKNKDLPAPAPEDPDDCQIKVGEANGRIEFLSGLSYFEIGALSKARDYFLQALARLGLTLPEDDGKIRRSPFLFGAKIKLWRAQHCCKTCRSGMQILDRQAARSWATKIRILSYLHIIYKSEKKMDFAFLVTMHQVVTAEKYGNLMQDAVPAYCCMMEMYSALSKHSAAERYEKLALKIIRSSFGSAEQVEAVGLLTSANLFLTISSIRLYRGCISSSTEAAYLALRIAQTIHDNSLTITILPLLIQSLLFSIKIIEVIDALRKLWYTSEEEEDWGAVAMYYIMCLELLLNSTFAMEPFGNCEQFVVTTDWSADINMFREYEVQYAIESSLALWCARYSRWEHSQKWIKLAESHKPKITTMMSTAAELKLLEANLIFVNHYLDTKRYQHFAKSKNNAKRLLRLLHNSTIVIPALRPRLTHLVAYYYKIRSRDLEAEKHMKKAENLALEHGNKLEIEWITHNRTVWAGLAVPTVKNFWLEHTESHTLDWHNYGNVPWVNIMYSLPLPAWK